jgi:hypothetical protein
LPSPPLCGLMEDAGLPSSSWMWGIWGLASPSRNLQHNSESAISTLSLWSLSPPLGIGRWWPPRGGVPLTPPEPSTLRGHRLHPPIDEGAGAPGTNSRLPHRAPRPVQGFLGGGASRPKPSPEGNGWLVEPVPSSIHGWALRPPSNSRTRQSLCRLNRWPVAIAAPIHS